MTIATFDQLIAATKQVLAWSRPTKVISSVACWHFISDIAGNPGVPAAIAVGNTANGLVPTDASSGFIPINFSSGTGYLAGVQFGSSVACRLAIYDRLFHAGAYNFNAAVTLTAQPSYASRVPGGNYAGLQLWYEQVTLGNNTQSIAVTYTNEAGATGHTTGTVALGAALEVGASFQLPLAAGDLGVQKIESVTGSGAIAGTFNVFVARPLWCGRVPYATGGDWHGPDKTGLPQVYADSALAVMVRPDDVATGAFEILATVASA